MMQIRSVAVGLAISVYLMIHHYVDFARWALRSSDAWAFQETVKSLMPSAGPAIGDGLVLPGLFMLACVSVGLVAGSLLWPVAERAYFGLVEGFVVSVNHLKGPARNQLRLQK